MEGVEGQVRDLQAKVERCVRLASLSTQPEDAAILNGLAAITRHQLSDLRAMIAARQ
ncbi:hypothetical protein [Muricoccus aerilatus]|uniref:hypothetical protein n=1 Tax=Muricoccus aerilatus TaxID=452982 RepID=UPI000AE39D8B|nr:hypothetical protein [Roseomonas aerilata]